MRELETSVTQKGQVTIPAEIRARLGLKPKDKVIFTLEGEVVTLWPAASKVLRGYGAVVPSQRPEDFQEIRKQVEQAIAEEVTKEG